MHLSRRATVAMVAGMVLSMGVANAQTPAGALDLASYKGKIVYLDFWASWCAPCQQSFPYMDALVKRLPASDFVVIAVNVDHDRKKADAFLKRVGGAVPVIFDPEGKLATKFDVKAMPTSLLIDRTGRTRFVHQGFFPEQISAYDTQISELVHEK
jgi:thiol-disulfide isomerase/thioredoxin